MGFPRDPATPDRIADTGRPLPVFVGSRLIYAQPDFTALLAGPAAVSLLFEMDGDFWGYWNILGTFGRLRCVAMLRLKIFQRASEGLEGEFV